MDESHDRSHDIIASIESNDKSLGIIPAGIERLVKEFKNPTLDWRTILNDFVQEEICDYSFTPPDRRMEDSPIMTDREYDSLVLELKMPERMTGIHFSNSPIGKVPGDEKAELKTVRHSKPMLSWEDMQILSKLGEVAVTHPRRSPREQSGTQRLISSSVLYSLAATAFISGVRMPCLAASIWVV